MSEEFYVEPTGAPAPKQGGRQPWLWPVVVVAIVAILVPVMLFSRAPAETQDITLSTLNDKLIAISLEQSALKDRLISLEGEMGGLAGTVGSIETHLAEIDGTLDSLDNIAVVLDELSVAVASIHEMLAACNCTAPDS